jgi:hypothetical protein
MFIGMAHDGGLQLSVESLNNATAGGMPCSRQGQGGSDKGSQDLEETGLELPVLVGCDLLGTAATNNPN